MTLAPLRDKLRQGVFVDNLYDVARLRMQLLRKGDFPLPMYVLSRILIDVADLWDEQAVTVAEGEQVQSILGPPIERLLEAMERGESDQRLFELLTDVVKSRLATELR